MSKHALKVVAQAQSWLGCKESDGTHKKIIDVYNDHRPLARGYTVKYSDAWCATFVSAVAIKLGYTDIIPTECSCAKMVELFKKLGSWQESDAYVPNPGDVIFYDWQDNGSGDNVGSPDHVGYVEGVSGNKISVIEGNYSNSVSHRTLEVGGKYIRGYGVPKYDTLGGSADAKYRIQIEGLFGKDEAEIAAEKIKSVGFNASIVGVEEDAWVPKVGDTVYFNGAKHFRDANASTGVATSKGRAKITAIYKLGKSKHPYHLKRIGGSGPYGWVDAGSFVKA